jgi:cytochrome c553
MSDFHYVRTIGPDGGVDAADGAAIGLDLEAVLDGGLPPFNVALQIISAVAGILAIAAEDGVTHGDLDLGDVFLDDTGAVSVEGFGQTRTLAPEKVPVGPETDRFGLGAIAFALFSPRDLPSLPPNEEEHENAAIDAILALNFEELPEELIGDIQWYLARLLAWQPSDRPSAVEAWRAFERMVELVEGPDFPTWCNAAIDGGGERRDNDEASRPMQRGPLNALEDTTVTGGPMPKGAVNFADGPADKGRSTAFWTRGDMKKALQRALTSDYLEDPDTDWMPGTPIPPLDRTGTPDQSRPRRAPGTARRRNTDDRTNPRKMRAAAPSSVDDIRLEDTGFPSDPGPLSVGDDIDLTNEPARPLMDIADMGLRTGPPPMEHGLDDEIAPPPDTPLPSDFDLPDGPDDDARTELGAPVVPTSRPPTPRPHPVRSFEPPIPKDSPTVPAPSMTAPSAPGKPSRPRREVGGPTVTPAPAPDARFDRQSPSPPLAGPLPDPDTIPPQLVKRPPSPARPPDESELTPQPQADQAIGAISPLGDRDPTNDVVPMEHTDAKGLPPPDDAPVSSAMNDPIPDFRNRGPNPFADDDVPEEGGAATGLMLGGIVLVVVVAVVFCVGVGGVTGVAAFMGMPTEKAPDRPRTRIVKADPAPAGKSTEEPVPDVRPASRPSPRTGPRPTRTAPSPRATQPAPSGGAVRPGPSGTNRLPDVAGSPTPAPSIRPSGVRPSSLQPSPMPPAPDGVRPGALRPAPAPSVARTDGVGMQTAPALPPIPLDEDTTSIIGDLVPEPAPNPDGSGPSMLQSNMRAHLTTATAARNAVIQGDPTAARAAARTLEFVNQDEALPPDWLPYVVDLQMEAWLMGNSPDLAAAGFKVAQIGAACASCHEGVRAGPTVTPTAVPQRVFDEQEVMKRHAWAVDWMWVGLLANDQAAWSKGATELAEAPFPSVILEDFPEQGFMDLEDTLHELAVEGQTATSPDKRSLVFGKLLATCARCHARYRELEEKAGQR